MPVATAHRATPNTTIQTSKPVIDFRRARQIKRNVKLHKQIKDLITANPTCRYVGGNQTVENIAARLGFQPHDLAIADVKIGRRIVTLIVLPHRIWDRPFPAAKAIDLRFQAREAGHAAILVPQAVVEREPRLAVTRYKQVKGFYLDETDFDHMFFNVNDMKVYGEERQP